MTAAVQPDPSEPIQTAGESQAREALAAFLRQEYPEASRLYRLALDQQPDRAEWQAMLERSETNAEAAIATHVPELHYLISEELLAEPIVPAGTLPPPPLPIIPSLRQQALDWAGGVLGSVLTVALEGGTNALGRVLGYRDKVWTNWYRRQMFIGVLTLAYMRDRLNKHNLKTVYPRGALIAFQRPGQPPPPGVTHFRTADGSWNNLADPKEGAAGTRFQRNIELAAIKPESAATLLRPNPREVSRRLLARPPAEKAEMLEVPFLNLLAASWINFQNHGWISHGETHTRELIEIPLAADDPARARYGQEAIFVGRTQPDPTREPAGEPAPQTFVNEVSHWWDGSQIYGSDQSSQDRLRSRIDGKMRLNPDGTLPRDSHGFEDTGFRRNWWVGLSMWHTLFVREHNAICDMLKGAHPTWDDNRLFNVARLINAASMAKVHSIEWTPAILPNKALSDALNSNWFGYLTHVIRKGEGQHALAWINIRSPEMGGIIGNPIDKHGSPYGLTQEFVEVYRLHSLLPEDIHLRSLASDEVEESLPFPRTRHAAAAKLTNRIPMADLFFSFGTQHPGQLVLNNYPRFMQEMSIPGNPLFDLAAVDILRARERGVPRYNEFRRQLGLNPIRSFEDLTDDVSHLVNLKEVYGSRPEDIEKIDLLVGTLAEAHRPTGFGFGETLFQIFILNASRRLQADRFYTDSYNEETYTREGLEWVDRVDLKHMLLRHYPRLAGTGLANVKNAFEPWDTDLPLDPARHPLREFDRTLR